ncbi:MAG: alpha/beta fold hydrolase [Alphaproteobacteria bacterium]
MPATDLAPPLKQAGDVAYRETGDARRPAIVFLHGLGAHSVAYRAQLAELSDRFRVIAWDAPGYGGSRKLPEAVPGSDAYAGALARLLKSLGVESAHVVGSSWGSIIATRFAHDYPTQTRSLILSGPTTGFARVPQGERELLLNARLDAIRTAGPIAFAAQGVPRLVAANAGAEVRAFAAAFGEGLRVDGFEQAARMLFATDQRDAIGAVKAPILIVAGTEDKVAPMADHAETLAAAALNARLVQLSGCGHLPELEAPARLNQAIREFTGN